MIWPCVTCKARDWEEAGNLCKAGDVCAADDERQQEYEKFVASMAEHCRCASQHRPCDGVLAGGMCDNIQEEPEREEEENDDC